MKCDKREFVNLLKSFYSENVINAFLAKEWFERLNQFDCETIAKSLVECGKFRMNNLKEIEDYCFKLDREKKWSENAKKEPLSEDEAKELEELLEKYK